MSNKAQVASDDEELTEFLMDYVDPLENEEEDVVVESQEKRGRPRIQEMWSRVISLNTALVGD